MKTLERGHFIVSAPLRPGAENSGLLRILPLSRNRCLVNIIKKFGTPLQKSIQLVQSSSFHILSRAFSRVCLSVCLFVCLSVL